MNPSTLENPAGAAMRIMIVDDEDLARQRLRAILGDIEAQFAHRIVAEAGHGAQAIELLAAESVDLMIIDVQMPRMNGIELARHLASLPRPPAVVFVTAYDEFALKAFEVHALDFLVKPVRAQRLLETLQRIARLTRPQTAAIEALNQSSDQRAREFVGVHERGRVVLVPVVDILYLKAEQKYVTIRTAQKQYLTEESLVALEEEFRESMVRVHRNALVARGAIAGFERVEGATDEDAAGEPHWEVMVRGIDERLPVSRRQWPIVKGLLRR